MPGKPALLVPGGGFGHRLTLPLWHPAGGGGCRPTLPLALILPPSPQPPSPPGKGENFSFLMQGASPLASPGLDRLRHWLIWSLWHPAGVLLSLSPAYLAFSLLCCPLSPYPPPFPAGRGRFLVDFAGGFAPGTPAAEPIGLRKTDKKRSLRVIPPPTEAPVRQGQPVPRPVQPWGCKGRSPLHEITLNLPLPHRGRGLGGWGQKRTLKAGLGGWQSRQATAGCVIRPLFRCRPGSPPGMQGAKPLA